MKCPGLYKTIGLAGICVALFLASTAAWQLINPSIHDCAGEYLSDSAKITASKVVAQPWLGQHHVYGIFLIPVRYGDYKRYQVTMSIGGIDGAFDVGEGDGKVYESDIMIEEGHYPKQVYLPTRIALKGLVTGQFLELQTPCNWTLEFVERAPSNANIPLR